MKLLKISMFTLVVCLLSLDIHSQSNTQSYTLKKGEILDILLLTQKPDITKLFDRYKKTAFPVASKRSFKALPGFKISKNTQGGFHPEGFVLGKWDDLENREEFLKEIESIVPDFHKQRRDMWPIFNLTYYEMPNDVSFNINKDKFNVVTAYWKKDIKAFTNFKKDWNQKVKNKGGKNIIELTNGKSPFGYYYLPDYLVITQWENEAAFEAFYKDNLEMNIKGVLNVNQFVIN